MLGLWGSNLLPRTLCCGLATLTLTLGWSWQDLWVLGLYGGELTVEAQMMVGGKAKFDPRAMRMKPASSENRKFNPWLVLAKTLGLWGRNLLPGTLWWWTAYAGGTHEEFGSCVQPEEAETRAKGWSWPGL